MKGTIGNVIFVSLLLLLLLLPLVMSARHIGQQHSRHSHQAHHPQSSHVGKPNNNEEKRPIPPLKQRKPVTVQIAGSSLPDCSHACGSCSPCRLVMVSFVCASIEEAETCPMAYKCMCHNKSYPVP